MDRTKLKPGELRRANTARQAEWRGGERADLFFRGLELGGEAGELANLLKKQVRIDRCISGTAESQEALTMATRDEVGDVAICLDLLGMAFPCAVASSAVLEEDLTRDDLARLGNALMAKVGAVSDVLEDIISLYESGLVPDLNHRKWEMEACLSEASDALENICVALDLDLASCVTMKFNATSAKHGLETRIV